jgi:hypothetical protein
MVQYQYSSGEYIGNSIVLDGFSQITESIAVATQTQTHALLQSLYAMSSLRHTAKGLS